MEMQLQLWNGWLRIPSTAEERTHALAATVSVAVRVYARVQKVLYVHDRRWTRQSVSMRVAISLRVTGCGMQYINRVLKLEYARKQLLPLGLIIL
jgi:hypothetical protein